MLFSIFWRTAALIMIHNSYPWTNNQRLKWHCFKHKLTKGSLITYFGKVLVFISLITCIGKRLATFHSLSMYIHLSVFKNKLLLKYAYVFRHWEKLDICKLVENRTYAKSLIINETIKATLYYLLSDLDWNIEQVTLLNRTAQD